MRLTRKSIRRIVITSVLFLVVITIAVLLKDFIIEPLTQTNRQPISTMEYGIVTDSFKIIHDEIKPGESLGEMFTRYRVNNKILAKLHESTKGILDLGKIRRGNSYTAMFTNDPANKLQFFIYTVDDTSYVVFDFRDSLSVHLGAKEVLHRLRSASGTINSSLWATIEQSGADPNLAIALANIYQWTIDFYAIQKGDAFKVIYEEVAVDGKPVSMGEIHAAWFKHNGKEYYAHRFEQGSTTDYFDDKGQNLRKEFLKAPLKFSRITSKFSNSRFHPILRIRRPHHGVDYAAPKGTPVHSIANGVVEKAAYAGGAGRMISIRHNNGYSTSYMHLSGFGPGIHSGARVSQAQVIGYVGSSGLSTGPHLDFRVYRNGVAMDPLKIESPPALPVNPRYMPAFDSIRLLYETNLKMIK